MSNASATFRAIGTTHHLVVTDPATLTRATAIAIGHLAELDRAASRFRDDSEVSTLARAAASGPATAGVSPLLASYVRAALRAAVLSDGLVDPTVGAAVCAEGYDADLAVVQTRAYAGPRGGAVVPGWRSVVLDSLTGRLSVPQGTLLDLGASAKAHAADTIAGLLARELPGGFLVNLGGDLATSGVAPEHGWQIAVESPDGGTAQVVDAPTQAFATSATHRRRWRIGGQERHHVIDPRTGRVAPTPWTQVTCAGTTALAANAASTAALVLAADAPSWLAARGVPARLQHRDGTVVRVAGWPSSPSELPVEVAA